MSWKYSFVSREEFHQKKALVGEIILKFGGSVVDEKVCKNAWTEAGGGKFSSSPIYEFHGRYYKINEILFEDIPCIVLEWSDTLREAVLNVMEDINPFPYNWPVRKIERELMFELELEPYPDDWPDFNY